MTDANQTTEGISLRAWRYIVRIWCAFNHPDLTEADGERCRYCGTDWSRP